MANQSAAFRWPWALALTTILLISNSCGSGPPAIPPASEIKSALTQTTESAHFSFHYSAGDSVEADHEETYLGWLLPQLGVQPAQKIQYYKYRDRDQMYSVTSRQTNGWADPSGYSLHTIFPFDNHEVVHVVTALVGRPSDFFNEGIAVAMEVDPTTSNPNPIWNGQPVHIWAKNFLVTNHLAHPLDIATSDSFRAVPESEGYPTAGSFVRYLIDQYGMAKMNTFFKGGTRDESQATISTRFQQVFGISLTEADQNWRTFISNLPW